MSQNITAQEAALVLQSTFLREASERAVNCLPVTQAEVDDRARRVEEFKQQYPDAPAQSIAVLEEQVEGLRALFVQPEGMDDMLW